MNLALTALTRCLLAGTLVSLGACAASAGTTADPPKQQASVTLARSTCFGNCPGYTVTVDGASVRTCSSTLVLRNAPDATAVHVHVTRGGPCAKPKLP